MNGSTDILVINDNQADVELISELLAQPGVSRVQAAADGVEALALLQDQCGNAARQLPDMILLDLNMPRLDGRAVLGKLKSDPRLRTIPIVVFTTSRARSDIAYCYHLGANSYLTKPGNLRDFECAVKDLQQFWLRLASLPPKEPR